MAKIAPKGKKVTGTKKKDKIVSTGKGVWKKALTVNAGKGNDVIDFRKSKYKNTLNGQEGKDVIYGGKKNDKITGGKGNDVIYAYRISNSKNSASYNNTGVRDTSYTYGDITAYLYGEEGNDTIYAIGENVEITDYYGENLFEVGLTSNVKIKTARFSSDNIENKVRVRQPNQNALLVFDINASTDTITYSNSGNGFLWITNDVSLESWVNTGSFKGTETGTRYGAIQVTNSSNKAEENSCKIIAYYGTKKNENYKQISRTAILEMQQEVASWLADNGYSSVNAILTGTNSQAKTDLIAKFVDVNTRTDINTRYWVDMG